MSAPTHEEMVALCDRYIRGEVPSEEYFAEVDRRAEHLISEAMRRRRPVRARHAQR